MAALSRIAGAAEGHAWPSACFRLRGGRLRPARNNALSQGLRFLKPLARPRNASPGPDSFRRVASNANHRPCILTTFDKQRSESVRMEHSSRSCQVAGPPLHPVLNAVAGLSPKVF